MDSKEKISKIVRTVTAAPVFAFLMALFMYLLKDEAFNSVSHFILTLVFLVILPLSAYPIARLVPSLKKRGRNTERNLAILFSVVGYIGGEMCAFLLDGTSAEKVIFTVYLLSGVALAVCTLLHFKASGHACGCSGPVAILAYFISPLFLLGYLLLIPVFTSSLRLKRHTLPQLCIGTLVPIVALAVSVLIFI